jgi:hypothetical protein
VKQTIYDDVDRPTRVTTGAPLLGLLASDGTSDLRLSYTRRGLVRSTASSYGTLVSSETRDARGLLKTVVYGDLAQTRRSYTYNVLTQVQDVQTYRTPTDLWTADPGTSPYVPPPVTGPNTTQVLLEDYAFTYDVMGNLTVAQDLRTLEEWPDTAKPVQRTFAYDSYSRLKQATYAYAAGSAWQSPFEAENTTSTRLPQPSPQISFASRIYEETFRYDWLNNLIENSDDANAFYDRSTGTSTFADSNAPHRLTSATNRSTSSPNAGDLAAAYDDAGQVTAMIVKREGNCLPNGASCSQRFAYEWDEVGNLLHAARWDLTSDERTQNGTLATNPPARAPDQLHL